MRKPKNTVRSINITVETDNLGTVEFSADEPKKIGTEGHNYFGDEGLFLWPYLTEVGSRFDSRTILESILEPSKVIDDKYRNVAVTTRKGELIMGRIVAEKDNSILLASNPYQPALTREIDRRTIASRKDSGFSPMPVGLLNSFSRNDIIDLLSLLETGRGTTPWFYQRIRLSTNSGSILACAVIAVALLTRILFFAKIGVERLAHWQHLS